MQFFKEINRNLNYIDSLSELYQDPVDNSRLK